MKREDLDALVAREDQIVKEIVELALDGVLPENFPPPYRKMFAQAVVPFRDSRSRIESRKGLRLLGYFYPGQTTFERIPGWIRDEIKNRAPKEERTAERLRADIPKSCMVKKRKRQLDELFRKLSSGEISRREFEDATGKEWWWGDILEGLGNRGLPYPVVDMEKKWTDAQRKLADGVFRDTGGPTRQSQ